MATRSVLALGVWQTGCAPPDSSGPVCWDREPGRMNAVELRLVWEAGEVLPGFLCR